ncbi:sodium/proline symporter PutP [Listeria aquatica]|uniref:sodium/proline symporter PutP n=1 Tax=Listeria aquatica TaxID=1494960 RepID=UPI003EF9DC58
MEFGVYFSVGVYLLLMVAIGIYAYRKTNDMSDYMLGGRSLGPAVTALSAGAADMSGWMIMGLPGAIYSTGLATAWLALGLVLGCYLNYIIVAPRLRVYTEVAKDSLTLPDFFKNRFQDKSNVLRVTSGLILIIFSTLYVTSGIVSGGKLFESTFGAQYLTGVLITMGIVVIYTFIGGFLAVSLTDFVQGALLLLALVVVPIVTLTNIGAGEGVKVYHQIVGANPDFFNIVTDVSILTIIGYLAWGLGYAGQPHIIVRFMAIKSHKQMKSARRYGVSWMIVNMLGSMGAGLTGLFYFKQQGLTLADPETVFLKLADVLFNPYITGFILAGALAAIMSTISSQILVASSSLVNDLLLLLFKKKASSSQKVLYSRLAVLLVSIAATVLAFMPNKTILEIVGYAWAGFGSAFGPMIIFSLYWKRMTKEGAVSGMLTGGIVVVIWIVSGLSSWLYEMVPGFLLSCLAIIIVSKLTKAPQKGVLRQHQDQNEILEK